MKIREMTQGDLHYAVQLAADMHQESWFRDFDFDAAKALSIWDRKVSQPDRWCLLVAEDDNKIVGIFAGITFEHFFGNQTASCDLILYVDPAHRGGSAAPRLIKAYEEWARSVGVVEIQIGVSTGVNTERTARLFEKLGFGDRAYIFKKRV
jgi:GNAT superfamily N-acetyltransferase